MTEFFVWATLATIAGATAATAYITQFLKKFNFFNKLNSQAVSYGVAVLILFLATYFTGTLTLSTGIMIFFNAIIVAFSSNGAYDSLKSTIAALVANKPTGTVNSFVDTESEKSSTSEEIAKAEQDVDAPSTDATKR